MNLTEAQIASIVYEKDSGDISARVILPVSVPSSNVRAIDLSDVPVLEREEISKLYMEYIAYKEAFMSNMFNFETWVEHSTNKVITPKWRAFKLSGLR